VKSILDQIPVEIFAPVGAPGCLRPINVSNDMYIWVRDQANSRNMPRNRFLTRVLELLKEEEERSDPHFVDIQLRKYYIECPEREEDAVCWWKPNLQGYTYDLAEAGEYSLDQATKIQCDSGGVDKPWRVDFVKSVVTKRTVARADLMEWQDQMEASR
jgi:hypothetical protein